VLNLVCKQQKTPTAHNGGRLVTVAVAFAFASGPGPAASRLWRSHDHLRWMNSVRLDHRHEASCRMCRMRPAGRFHDLLESFTLRKERFTYRLRASTRLIQHACIFFCKDTHGAQISRNIRGGTQGAAKRVGFARSGSRGGTRHCQCQFHIKRAAQRTTSQPKPVRGCH
jgi:hypothetical protein